MKMRKPTFLEVVGLSTGLLLLAVTALAQTATTTPASSAASVSAPSQSPMAVRIERSGRAQLEGTLVSISGTNLTVTSWGGNWIVDASQAQLVRRYGGKSDLSEFQVGDALQIQGNASAGAWSLVATLVKDNSIQVRNVDFSGIISNLNVSGQSFTLTAKNGQVLQVTLKATGKVYVNGQESTFSALVSGTTVRVRGILDRTLKTVMAERIDYRQERGSVSGTISNLNASAKSFSLVTEERGTYQVTLKPDAIVRINNGPAAFSDLQNGMSVRVRGFGDRNLMTITAEAVNARFVTTPQSQPKTSTSTY